MATSGLFERTDELAVIESVLRAGTGVLVIEGAAGIGKSSLVHATADAGEDSGFDVLRARGSGLEAGFGFGVVRQLFERRLATAPDVERDRVLRGAAALAGPLVDPQKTPPAASSDGGEAALAMAHALYWVTANLAAQRPLLLAVDDAHWADAASLRFLAYLAPRVHGLPLVLVAAVRTGEPAAQEPSLRAVTAAATVVRPRPLSPDAVRAVVEEALGPPALRLARACSRVTGGNPLYLHRLVWRLREQGDVEHLTEDDVLGTGGAELAEDVHTRVARGGEGAIRLAEAVATLGDHQPLGLSAELAGLDVDSAGEAARVLCDLDVLSQPQAPAFVHPVVRAAIEERLPAGVHRRAADLLADRGAPVERIAAHAYRQTPAGHAPTVERLRAAARVAMARGAPEAAVSLLERAVAEPPVHPERSSVLLELGQAAAWSGHPEATAHLEAAMSAAPDAVARATAARVLARAHAQAMDHPRAVAVLREALAQLDGRDPDLLGAIQLQIALSGMQDARLVAETMPAIEGLAARPDDPAARELLGLIQGMAVGFGGGSAEQIAAIMDAAPPAPDGATAGWELRAGTSFAYMSIERLAQAQMMFDEARRAARSTGNARAALTHVAGEAMLAWMNGNLADAVGRGVESLRLANAMGAVGATTVLYAIVALSQLEMGRVPDAVATLEEAPIPEDHAQLMTALLYTAHAALAAARGDHAGAVEAISRGDARFASLLPVEVSAPAMWSWRTPVIPALVKMGRTEEARAQALRELEQARAWGSRRPLGLALRVAALTVDGAQRVGLLEEAVEVLRTSTARLELAHALVELGATKRRQNRRGEARPHLSKGLDHALACGALPLADRARRELALAGGRPRRGRTSGADALTPAEWNVARLAAAGRTNREIAEQLHVVRKTVETHLANIYSKLGIEGRGELGAALPPDRDEPPRPAS